ncbi:MAG: helix-turn-helix transcriptional regulator [Prevotella sp.]|nr:helix-turn-helix transcriptional regulator [Prevotella sp.]
MSGEELKKKLAETGISLTKISGMLGKTPQQLDQALNAKDVKTGLVEDLCRVLNVDIAFFYGAGDRIVAVDNSTAFKGNGNTVGAGADKYLDLLSKKDEQIDRLLGIIEGMNK